MTTASISLQDLRRRLYVKAKAGFGWKRWSTAWLYDTRSACSQITEGRLPSVVPEPGLKVLPADRSHNP